MEFWYMGMHYGIDLHTYEPSLFNIVFSEGLSSAFQLTIDNNAGTITYQGVPIVSEEPWYYFLATWHHFQIQWNCLEDTFQLWIDGVNGGQYDFATDIQAIDKVTLATPEGDADHSCVILDAIDFSWERWYYPHRNIDHPIEIHYGNKPLDEAWFKVSSIEVINVTADYTYLKIIYFSPLIMFEDLVIVNSSACLTLQRTLLQISPVLDDVDPLFVLPSYTGLHFTADTIDEWVVGTAATASIWYDPPVETSIEETPEPHASLSVGIDNFGAFYGDFFGLCLFYLGAVGVMDFGYFDSSSNTGIMGSSYYSDAFTLNETDSDIWRFTGSGTVGDFQINDLYQVYSGQVVDVDRTIALIGNYDGTLSFTADSIGADPSGVTYLNNEVPGEVDIRVAGEVTDKNGNTHSHVMELWKKAGYDLGGELGAVPSAEIVIDPAQPYGATELWVLTPNSETDQARVIKQGRMSGTEFIIANGFLLNDGQLFRISDLQVTSSYPYIEYTLASVTNYEDNTWLHLRITFECTDGGYDGLPQWYYKLYVRKAQNYANEQCYGPFKFAQTDFVDTLTYLLGLTGGTTTWAGPPTGYSRFPDSPNVCDDDPATFEIFTEVIGMNIEVEIAPSATYLEPSILREYFIDEQRTLTLSYDLSGGEGQDPESLEVYLWDFDLQESGVPVLTPITETIATGFLSYGWETYRGATYIPFADWDPATDSVSYYLNGISYPLAYGTQYHISTDPWGIYLTSLGYLYCQQIGLGGDLIASYRAIGAYQLEPSITLIPGTHELTIPIQANQITSYEWSDHLVRLQIVGTSTATESTLTLNTCWLRFEIDAMEIHRLILQGYAPPEEELSVYFDAIDFSWDADYFTNRNLQLFDYGVPITIANLSLPLFTENRINYLSDPEAGDTPVSYEQGIDVFAQVSQWDISTGTVETSATSTLNVSSSTLGSLTIYTAFSEPLDLSGFLLNPSALYFRYTNQSTNRIDLVLGDGNGNKNIYYVTSASLAKVDPANPDAFLGALDFSDITKISFIIEFSAAGWVNFEELRMGFTSIPAQNALFIADAETGVGYGIVIQSDTFSSDYYLGIVGEPIKLEALTLSLQDFVTAEVTVKYSYFFGHYRDFIAFLSDSSLKIRKPV
ncbi:MAG TPA: hypothetical protein VMV49_13745, partial [Candidatus Deferrimicrobium sp.]|nr:hypothetical protein [Candidatus Deferrimicrobium sp.]